MSWLVDYSQPLNLSTSQPLNLSTPGFLPRLSQKPVKVNTIKARPMLLEYISLKVFRDPR